MQYQYYIFISLTFFSSIVKTANRDSNIHGFPPFSSKRYSKGMIKINTNKTYIPRSRRNHKKQNSYKSYLDSVYVPEQKQDEMYSKFVQLFPGFKAHLENAPNMQSNRYKVVKDNKRMYLIMLIQKLWKRYPRKCFDINYYVAPVGRGKNNIVIFMICKVKVKVEKQENKKEKGRIKMELHYVNLVAGRKKVIKAMIMEQKNDQRKVTAYRIGKGWFQYAKGISWPEKSEEFDEGITVFIGSLRLKLKRDQGQEYRILEIAPNHLTKCNTNEDKLGKQVKLAKCWYHPYDKNTYVMQIPEGILLSKKARVFILRKTLICCTSSCQECLKYHQFKYSSQIVKNSSDIRPEEAFNRLKIITELYELTLPTKYPSVPTLNGNQYLHYNSNNDYRKAQPLRLKSPVINGIKYKGGLVSKKFMLPLDQLLQN